MLFDWYSNGNRDGRAVGNVVEPRFKFIQGNNDVAIDADNAIIDNTVAGEIIKSQMLKASSAMVMYEDWVCD